MSSNPQRTRSGCAQPPNVDLAFIVRVAPAAGPKISGSLLRGLFNHGSFSPRCDGRHLLFGVTAIILLRPRTVEVEDGGHYGYARPLRVLPVAWLERER